jgi:hypothetical protein
VIHPKRLGLGAGIAKTEAAIRQPVGQHERVAADLNGHELRAGKTGDLIAAHPQTELAGAARAGVPFLVHHQSYAFVVFTGDDLELKDHWHAARALMQRIGRGQPHGLRLALKERQESSLPAAGRASGGDRNNPGDLLIENSLDARHAPVGHELGIGLRHRA